MWKCPKCKREFKNENQSHYCGEKPKTIEEYILLQDEEKQADLFLVREVLQQALPEAEERISWSMPTYWKKHNTDYATVDMRFGVKATKEVAFQFMINNLLNKEYSYRPMAVGAPRTFVVKMDVTF